ncbi:MAG: hypothetical protein AMJ90_06745 [candidate division Zixibacteria bacterium SM23_73_2]|nr:MAG: hypothetical protein AMJ90_06745 [candidate division Zixibacteria bacterium SM23_73_2]
MVKVEKANPKPKNCTLPYLIPRLTTSPLAPKSTNILSSRIYPIEPKNKARIHFKIMVSFMALSVSG